MLQVVSELVFSQLYRRTYDAILRAMAEWHRVPTFAIVTCNTVHSVALFLTDRNSFPIIRPPKRESKIVN